MTRADASECRPPDTAGSIAFSVRLTQLILPTDVSNAMTRYEKVERAPTMVATSRSPGYGGVPGLRVPTTHL